MSLESDVWAVKDKNKQPEPWKCVCYTCKEIDYKAASPTCFYFGNPIKAIDELIEHPKLGFYNAPYYCRHYLNIIFPLHSLFVIWPMPITWHVKYVRFLHIITYRYRNKRWK